MRQYRTKDGDTLDAICWAHYGRQAGAVEAVLEANRALAAQGPILPSGLVIDLPDLADPPARAVVRLWS